MRKIIVAIIAIIFITTTAQAQESTMGLMFSMSFSSIANLFTARKGEIDKAKISAFSQRKTDITGKAETEFISFKNETATSYLPLATWGKDIKYPGLVYNQGDEQFYNVALNAAEGKTPAIEKLIGYGIATIGIGTVAVIALSNSSSEKSEPEVEKDTTVQPKVKPKKEEPKVEPKVEPPKEEPPKEEPPKAEQPKEDGGGSGGNL